MVNQQFFEEERNPPPEEEQEDELESSGSSINSVKNAAQAEAKQEPKDQRLDASMLRINLRVENVQVDEKQCLIG